ncbi:MAG: PadR family transcriptional regulator [Clostridium sp.]|nr:PadR family transcriptional regulator [Clostridium sp.]
MDAQLKRGILSMCILQLLKEDRYGYDLVKLLQEFFPDTEESTLYAVLRRLNKEGLTDMHDSEISHGPKRKYYRISKKGEERLKDYIASWSEIEKIFGRIGIIIGFDQIRREDGL